MSEIRYLFRFRDLVAATIEEHQAIIDGHGSCWWGWWKRPSEDARADVWAALGEALAAGPQVVGLFDSGSKRLFRATVTEIIPPASGSDDAGDAVKVPVGEGTLVPAYYRDSPFSRAWLRFTRIEPLKEFFGNHSFAEAPPLPGYTPATLFRLRGKRIFGAEELRSMDTTIWEVRRALPQDPSEQILFSVAALPSAVSRNAVECRSDAILHITDLHFAVGKQRGQHAWRMDGDTSAAHTMVQAIRAALGSTRVGLVIASGDFTFIGTKEEFSAASAALSLLLGVLDLSTDHLIIVPGNHDIQWGTTDAYSDGAKVESAPASARANYEEFYKTLMRHEPNEHLAMGRRYVLPSGLVIEVCALNSSSLCVGRDFLAGMGRIDEASFTDVAGEMGWKSGKPSLALRMLVIHHHLAVTEDLEPAEGFARGYGMAVDAVRVQRLAAKHGVHVALHGHKHRAFIWRSNVYETLENTKPRHKVGALSIVGGGSAGSTDTPSASNYFNILTAEPAGVKLEIYRSIAIGAFELMKTFVAPISTDSDGGSLLIDDWVERT